MKFIRYKMTSGILNNGSRFMHSELGYFLMCHKFINLFTFILQRTCFSIQENKTLLTLSTPEFALLLIPVSLRIKPSQCKLPLLLLFTFGQFYST